MVEPTGKLNSNKNVLLTLNILLSEFNIKLKFMHWTTFGNWYLIFVTELFEEFVCVLCEQAYEILGSLFLLIWIR